MPEISYKEAIRSAIREEMRRDPRVFVMGQDIEVLAWGGGAKLEFQSGRIRNVPISEAAVLGSGIGAALTGMRPIVEMSCAPFLYSAMDQLINQAAKSRYMFGGQASVPLVVRASVLYGMSLAAHHSDRPWGLFAQAPGLKIVVPSCPYDAKGLLKAAVRDGNPVLYLEDDNLAGLQGEVPDDDFNVPIGTAQVKRAGSDVSIVAIASAVNHSVAAAQRLQDEGISVEVVDVRSVAPLDRRTILQSVAKTGRLIVVDPAPRTCGLAAEVAATVAEQAFESLKAAVVRLTAPDVPVPFSPSLERLMYPTEESIAAAVRKLCTRRPAEFGAERRYDVASGMK